MAKANNETLHDYKTRTGKKQARNGRQPASYVPPKYSNKPKDQQVMTGLYGVDEVKFTDGTMVWVCHADEYVFPAVNSAAAHRSAHGRARNKLLAQEEAAKQSEEEAKQVAEKVLGDVVEKLQSWDEQWFIDNGFPKAPEYSELIDLYVAQVNRAAALQRELKSCREEYHKLAGVAEENIRLHQTVEQYAAELFPQHLRVKFIEMMAESLENIGDKWLEMVQLNREHNKAIKTIIES